MCVVVGGLLSLAAVGLKDAQKKARDLDTKKQILGAVRELKDTDDVLKIYAESIQSEVVDIEGNVVDTSIPAEEIDVSKEYKKDPAERLFPVFKYKGSPSSEEIDAYIVPIYGSGLWDKIWGFVALKNDFNTIEGIVFDHKGETPGLGARITEKEVQQRYNGKHVMENGQLVSVTMLKGEKHPLESMNDHQVDGMSGATLTADGVNDMLKAYLGYYQAYFNKVKGM
nr:NADH:ubiquinone reductase (Na(+)-transporting) subunit C [Xanthovirga aplysinae]